MARWENFAGLDITQQDNFYCYWQRENLEVQASPPSYRHGSWCEQPHSSVSLLYYGYDCTVDGNGPRLPSTHETPEPPSGTWVLPETLAFFEESRAPGEDHAEDTLEDPNLHLDIEELNKEFMASSEEVYDSLTSCHWQPLDTVYSNIPEESPK